MPFASKEKNKRRDIILRAIEEISKRGKIKTTACKYDIPRSNLQRYLKQNGALKDVSSKFISNQICTNDEEKKMSEYLTTSSKLNYGLSKVQTRQLAFDYACAIQKKFSPEATYNIDKTGLSTVQQTQKVITPKGTKQVGQATSAERDEDFLCSSVTDRFGTDNVSTEQRTPSQASAEQLLTEENQNQVDPTSLNNMAASGPFQLESPIRNPTEESETITPDSVRPYPKAGPRKLIDHKFSTVALKDVPTLHEDCEVTGTANKLLLAEENKVNNPAVQARSSYAAQNRNMLMMSNQRKKKETQWISNSN
ncbi:hypothetical protein ILUMI_22996 [Ignelater luminosus]|uniref:HTH psq-type domain-containing protein n=1 Tax=Ignelater luminosus TaxID=2038154 RepID=A0A8K0C9L2_IGNLU|nr:hypothetical protein ILUMI_22996 [Ignelater luminosus]